MTKKKIVIGLMILGLTIGATVWTVKVVKEFKKVMADYYIEYHAKQYQ
ncbi:hypothetical protein FB550_101776 [Neobacillus bataviensis]|uniref:Uncharacterized protein n=1 Tax=Neobacillus bataviensis TaxID=220685 RepID=A0A561DZE9_9BACI|nr:hypothetical protein [Neobacillus bataviensis]TWE08748.1 hypothetical protein FB550_101776 [Neobacillus bataviensis]